MDGKGTGLVAWRKGPWVPSVDLWLDAPPVVRGLRFVSSCQVAAGRHGDRAIASAFTGRFHFGSDGAFLSAPPREPIRLGPVEARLLPSGHVLGGM
ncbi:MAG: hypothetical protein FJ098_15060, partial [Deltaproteobacteria bacterium]|nr:hypothetical protein [Deltaproteobacteria bacterium]